MTSSFVETGTILDRILARTALDVAARRSQTPVAELMHMAEGRPAPLSLAAALSKQTVAVIAEFKRASPSKGRFPFEAEPADVARDYIAGGAAAMSVLTDEPFFQGSLDDMRAAALVTHAAEKPAPVLRKDFVLDSYQLYEALAFGADAVLLIVAALDKAALVRLHKEAIALGLSPLVEVHDEAEMERALAAGATVIGINNRNLHTFKVDLAVTERLAPLAGADAIVVGESGIFSAEHVARLAQAGARAVLVGESLIIAPDRVAAVRALAGVPVTM